MMLNIFSYLSLVFIFTNSVYSDEHSHSYKDNEEVVLWMNTVGPYHNRQETYSYFSLPFCPGPKETIGHYHETLGEGLQGVELEFSGLDIDFKADVAKTQYCEAKLTVESYQAFVYAVKNHYWYQMYIDDLPIWGIVGEIDEGGNDLYIWTHKKFDIGYNEHQIVDVNLTSEAKLKLSAESKIPFTYEVRWHKSAVKFADRFDKYLDPNFFQHRIHWFSIFNSFMMVIFLVGLVSMILMRTLRKDYARYSKEDDLDDMERDLGDEYGWKQVHGDVFRPATYPMLFSALIGTGYQIATVATCVISFAIVGELYTERGSILSTAIFVYAATSLVNGYFGGSLYARMGGKVWIKQMIFSAFLLPALICGTAFFINFIAIYYHTPRAIPFGTMLRDIGRKYKGLSEEAQKEVQHLQERLDVVSKNATEAQQKLQDAEKTKEEQLKKTNETKQEMNQRLLEAENKLGEMARQLGSVSVEKGEMDGKLKNETEKRQKVEEDINKFKEVITRLQTLEKKLRDENEDLEKKQTQSRNLLQTAKSRMADNKEQLDKLTEENKRMKDRLQAGGSTSHTEDGATDARANARPRQQVQPDLPNQSRKRPRDEERPKKKKRCPPQRPNLQMPAKNVQEGDESDAASNNDGRLASALAIIAAVSAFGSSFPHGWNTGVLNAPQQIIKDFLNGTYEERTGNVPSVAMLNFIWPLSVAIYLAVGCAGALSVGWMADKFGRY